MVNSKASPRKRVSASSATKVQKAKADLAAEQAARASLAAAKVQKAKVDPVAESPARASTSARRSSASTAADGGSRSVIYAKRAPPKVSAPTVIRAPPQKVQDASSPNFTFGGSGEGAIDWFASLGVAGDEGTDQKSPHVAPAPSQPDADSAALTQAQMPNLDPPTSESTWGGLFRGTNTGLNPTRTSGSQATLNPEEEGGEENVQPSFRFGGGGGDEIQAPSVRQRYTRDRILPRTAREHFQEPPNEAIHRRISPDRRRQEEEQAYSHLDGLNSRFGNVREAMSEALAETLSNARAWLEWLSRALIFALAGTGLAFLFFLALSLRHNSTLPFCDQFHTDSSSAGSAGSGINIGSDATNTNGSSSPKCTPCPAHGACQDGALVGCASGYEIVDLRYDHSNASSTTNAPEAATAADAGAATVGTGRCVQTWGSWIMATVFQHPWLLLLAGVVMWTVRQRRREQWRAAAAERWLHTCWALLADNGSPIPVDWLQHKVVLTFFIICPRCCCIVQSVYFFVFFFVRRTELS